MGLCFFEYHSTYIFPYGIGGIYPVNKIQRKLQTSIIRDDLQQLE